MDNEFMYTAFWDDKMRRDIDKRFIDILSDVAWKYGCTVNVDLKNHNVDLDCPKGVEASVVAELEERMW